MNLSILLGIAGPLAVVSVSWLLMAQTFRRDPTRLTSLMMMAFGAKMLFFAVYVPVALTVFGVRPGPFAASFAIAFVTLYGVEAVSLRRLLAGRSA